MNRFHKSYLLSFITLLSLNFFEISLLNFNKVLAEESIRDQYNSYAKRSINNAQFMGVNRHEGYYFFVDEGGIIYKTKSGNSWEKLRIKLGDITSYYEKTDECKLRELSYMMGGDYPYCFETQEVKRETVVEDNKLVIYVKKGEGSPERFVIGYERKLKEIDDLTKVIENTSNDDDYKLLRRRALLKRDLKDYSGAIDDLTKAMDASPNRTEEDYSRFRRGEIKYEFLKDYEGGCRDLEKAARYYWTARNSLRWKEFCKNN